MSCPEEFKQIMSPVFANDITNTRSHIVIYRPEFWGPRPGGKKPSPLSL